MAILGWTLTVLVVYLLAGLRVAREYERLVVYRLGRLVRARGPGLTIVFPIFEQAVRVDLRLVTIDVPPQDVITRDNVSVKVDGVVLFQVVDAARSQVEVEDYRMTTSLLAQTTLRSVCGQADLDTLLAEREQINAKIQGLLAADTAGWGIRVVKVEVKQLDLPQEMQRAMAKQAEAERERRAKVTNAEGEFQAAEKLAQAAAIIGREPAALTLRYLQTLAEVATERNSTTIFPVPIEVLKAFMPKA